MKLGSMNAKRKHHHQPNALDGLGMSGGNKPAYKVNYYIFNSTLGNKYTG
jgi:hypothetical protein